ncbi:MAG TPA: superoxide dismutase [Methanomassiliicoccales archaeon]|nr:superoxide dismutase [Methanomassiliicoccales archaeon]
MPPLKYGYKDLEPFLSEEQLTIHHQKHHAAYANGANAAMEKLEKARKEGTDADYKAIAKELAFNVGGFQMHKLFWENLAPTGKGGGQPGGKVADELIKEFGSFERFKKEFTAVATSAEGSGWAALTFCKGIGRPMIMQIEKHNVNAIPGFKVMLALDVWEHAYYIDYKNLRPKYVETFWNNINWDAVSAWYDKWANH